MDRKTSCDEAPFTESALDYDGDAPPDEDSDVVAAAIRALVRGPRAAGPIDRSEEAAAVAAVTARVEALMASDPVALRRRLALHAEMAHAMAVIYTQRAAAASGASAQATYAGIALRSMAVGSRLLAMLGATAPRPDGDGPARLEADA